MSRQVLTIHPDRRDSDRAIRYEFALEYPAGRRETLFYEVERALGAAEVENQDGVLCALILHAMRERLNLRLHGRATPAILQNLREFQLAWSRWLPERYQQIEIAPDAEAVPVQQSQARALAALSGGVDSLFTLFSRNAAEAGVGAPVTGALMVHGFDVALGNTADFQELVDRTAEIRDLLGVSLRIIRTNSKELRLQNWEDSFAAQLAACMHFASVEFQEGLIGSSEPYDALVLPWGSNPVTDHLLSGGNLRIVHDGAAFSRTDKVAFLTRFPAALRTLKVCWEGEHQGRNCGVCEKCIRTQLNFLAAGLAEVPCFDGPLDLELIASVPIRNGTLLAEFRSICEYAEKRDIDAEWLRLLRARVRRGVENRTARDTAKDVLERLRLLGPASRLRDLLAR